ncbi:unnamed protein product, partial [Mesorhabditis belari]|uniref:Dymeclin n=1 Tax=Mesorhabditis belari TaxID=2138241 RepID=A0AAF3F4H6_9BILA
MGGVVSSTTKLEDNEALKKFCGAKEITDDTFWNDLFTFHLEIDERDSEIIKQVDRIAQNFVESLIDNSQVSRNLSGFLHKFFEMVDELLSSLVEEKKKLTFQVVNALTILHYVIKYSCQRLPEDELIKVYQYSIEPSVVETDSYCLLQKLIHHLVDLIIRMPTNDLTVPIQIEAVRTCLAILSSQLYKDELLQKSQVFNYFLLEKTEETSTIFIKVLLTNYLVHNEEYLGPNQIKKPESIVLGLAGSLWNMVTLAAGLDDSEETQQPALSLGSLSLLLALALACHNSQEKNPFKETLAQFQNSQEISTMPTPIITFKLDYNALYERLCSTVEQEPPMLLLYMLLHRNIGFRNYVLSRINLEKLVLPVLKILHNGANSQSANAHHMYLALIAVLILSEDDFFCKIIHETMVKGDWIDSDRPIGDISLGGLTILVFIRTLQKNAIRTKDRYLHTNSLAALANLASAFKNLNPVVCQKMVGLLELLTKRHAKLVELLRESLETQTDEGQNNYSDDITVLEEGIRTLLEIINTVLTSRLRYNANLIYTLLYHRKLFDNLKDHPMFQDLLKNIWSVIEHFSTKIEGISDGTSSIMNAIDDEVLIWRTDRLQKFPDLKFRYVEDENTIDFFVPYVWRLVFEHSGLRFEPSRVKVFNALLVIK